jgi:hypothetical protein
MSCFSPNERPFPDSTISASRPPIRWSQSPRPAFSRSDSSEASSKAFSLKSFELRRRFSRTVPLKSFFFKFSVGKIV